jgi:flagellar biosynthetic protein FliR
MTAEDAALLASLPAWSFALVLVMARIGAAMTMLPGLGEAEAPAMLRLGLTLGVTALLLPGIVPLIPPVPEDTAQAALMIAAEVITGLWLGWLARLLVLALPIAGQFISYMLGVANVLQPDPELGSQATPIARLFNVAAPVAILASGLYALPLAALAGSYRLIPPGSMLPGADTAQSAAQAASAAFGLAVRLAFVVMPGQILGGIALLAMLATALLGAWLTALRSGFALLPGH